MNVVGGTWGRMTRSVKALAHVGPKMQEHWAPKTEAHPARKCYHRRIVSGTVGSPALTGLASAQEESLPLLFCLRCPRLREIHWDVCGQHKTQHEDT